jgi:ribonuclease P/MRP protein subunit RPP40
VMAWARLSTHMHKPTPPHTGRGTTRRASERASTVSTAVLGTFFRRTTRTSGRQHNAAMLDLHKPPAGHDTKTYFSHSHLPSYIDAAHPPGKKAPFRAFAALPHAHTLDLLLPPEIWDVVRTHLAELDARVYARAYLSLSDILADDFLNAYVRNGSASMLAAGRDTRMSLVDGVLRLEMARGLYERAGLVGVPIEDGGMKHQRSRWVVECDLKAASMRRGKKGLERVLWAAKNVLGESRRWLFWSANPSFDESVGEGREVLSRHAPEVVALEPQVEVREGVAVPLLDVRGNGLSGLYDQEDALALLEWLDMLNLGSPRVRVGNDIDSHLCRYDVPDFGHGVEARGLVHVRWSGLLTPDFIRELFLAVWNAGFKSKRDAKKRRGSTAEDGDISMKGAEEEGDKEKWFSLSAQAFGGQKAWSLMQFANRETLVWEIES